MRFDTQIDIFENKGIVYHRDVANYISNKIVSGRMIQGKADLVISDIYIIDSLVDLINLEPDYVSILIGVNDVWHEVDLKNGVDAKRFEDVYIMLIEDIKAAFEIRAASILGFMPDILSCNGCGEKNGDFFLDVMGGIIECRACREKAAKLHTEHPDPYQTHIICILPEGAKIAFGYCIYSPIERIFSFNISEEDMRLFSRAAEEYLLNQLGHGFKTLDFYKDVLPG